MLRKFALSVLGVAAFGLALVAADEKKADPKKPDEKKEEKVPTIKDCMAFQGEKGLAKKIETEAKADKWDDAQKDAAILTKLGASLGKNTPKKNAEKTDEWQKLTKEFADKTAAVEKAAKDKKADDVSAAVKTLLDQKSCGGCHGTFKGK